MANKAIAVVGAGFTGAIIANELANAGYTVDVFEARGHIGGNCFTRRNEDTGIMEHVYGPHVFHTSNRKVWDYVRSFDEFEPYVQRTKATAQGRVYTLPINLLTINQFFGKTFSPNEAKDFILRQGDHTIETPANFEEQALKFVGRDLYDAFFKGYTEKQWGRDPRELPAHILQRLPVRFTYDDNYFNDTYQGLPRHGYSRIVQSMLDHHRIRFRLNLPFKREFASGYAHVFYSGPLDGWFDYSEGRLGYRTLDFTRTISHGDLQGCAVMNHCDRDDPYTRVTEHKYFTPQEPNDMTVAYYEESRECTPEDEPYYPIRLVNDKALLHTYERMATECLDVTMVGRLGTYRYLDMHIAIAEALDAAAKFLKEHKP